VLLKNRTGCLKSKTVLFFLIKEKHPRLMTLEEAPLIMGYEIVRAAANKNFCFTEEAEQGPDTGKVPRRTMKGMREKHYTKSKRDRVK